MSADVVTVGELDELHAASRNNRFDATILDFDMPGASRLDTDTLGAMRREFPAQPILACGSPDSAAKIAALMGIAVDDFILRPLDLDEIPIRVSRVIQARPRTAGTVLTNGDLRFDLVTRRIEVEGRHVELTARERGVLQILLRHKGEAIPKSSLAERLSTMEEEIAPQTVETYVHGLRKKLRNAGEAIKTIRGVGYLMTATECAAEG